MEEETHHKWMKRLYKTIGAIFILSIPCTVVGAIAISNSAPSYGIPYCIGGAMIAGLLECPIGIFTCLLVTALGLAVGYSGIWGIFTAEGDISLEQEINNSYQNMKQAKTNRDYAITSLVLTLHLCVLHIIACLQCTYLTNCFNLKTCLHFYTNKERSRRQQLPCDQYVTRENRSAEVLFSIPVPGIYHGITQQTTAVNLDSVFQNVPTANPDLEQGRQYVTAGSTDRPPPAYEDIEADRMPSYEEVVKEGRYI